MCRATVMSMQKSDEITSNIDISIVYINSAIEVNDLNGEQFENTEI